MNLYASSNFFKKKKIKQLINHYFSEGTVHVSFATENQRMKSQDFRLKKQQHPKILKSYLIVINVITYERRTPWPCSSRGSCRTCGTCCHACASCHTGGAFFAASFHTTFHLSGLHKPQSLCSRCKSRSIFSSSCCTFCARGRIFLAACVSST